MNDNHVRQDLTGNELIKPEIVLVLVITLRIIIFKQNADTIFSIQI